MPNIYRNIPIHELTEILGGQSANCKTCSGKTLRINEPALDEHRESVETQQTLQDALLQATTYANFARRQEVYVNKARDKHTTAYSLALTDWFGAPAVLLVNVDAWTGKPGQTIRVKAKDNVWVAGVTVVIRNAEGNVLESGEAVPSKASNRWWKYTTKTCVALSPFPRVEVTAWDLAGNQNTFILC